MQNRFIGPQNPSGKSNDSQSRFVPPLPAGLGWVCALPFFYLQVRSRRFGALWCVQNKRRLDYFWHGALCKCGRVTFTRALHALSPVLHDIFTHVVMPLTAHYDCSDEDGYLSRTHMRKYASFPSPPPLPNLHHLSRPRINPNAS